MAQMAQVMSHRSWYVNQTLVDAEHGLALGHLGIGIFNKTPQPVWNADRSVALLMAGEFYQTPSLPNNQQPPNSDEEMALVLYQHQGLDFVRQVKGTFIIAIWDKAKKQVMVVNDYFGLYPLFYAHHQHTLIFAPEIKAILLQPSIPKTLDMVAVAQYLRFQHLLGDRSFFEEIKLLPNGSILRYDLATQQFNIQPYRTWADLPHRPETTFPQAVEECGALMRKAVQTLSGDAYRPGVFLSGGLDSRAILGLIDHRPVATLTYGTENCRDVYYARRIAWAMNSHHTWVDFPDGHWVEECADFHLTLTEGLHSWIHAHGVSSLPKAREVMDINLTGWGGGTVMENLDSVEPLKTSVVDTIALTNQLFHLFNQKFTWPSLTEAEELSLYHPHVRSQMMGLAYDSFREALTPYFNLRADIRGELFYLDNHCGRLTRNFITFTRSYVEVRFPFFDEALLMFLYAIPAEIRGHRRLYRAMFDREMPHLARIPYDKDQLLPTNRRFYRGPHTLVTKIKNRIKHHFPDLARKHTLYADYESYLRHELRPWAEAILYNNPLLEDYFQPEAIRSLMERHVSGREEWTIGKIAPLMTLEMMLRRFFS